MADDADAFTVFGDLWIAPRYQRYSLIAASLWPRSVSVLPTLAELANLGLVVRSTITIEILGIEVKTITSEILEQAAEIGALKVLPNFRRTSVPASTVSAKLIHSVAARYPAEAASQKIDGVVVLEVTVAPDGSVRNPRLIRSLGYGLDEAAIESVLKWKYTPARRNGVAIDARVIVNVGFAYRERLSVPG